MSTEVAAERGPDSLEELSAVRPVTGVAIAVAGAIGLVAAFTLAIDKVRILEDPGYTPSCDLNPVLACGSVMRTDQAEAFGFPNPFLGIAAFAVVVLVGVLLAARVRLPGFVLVGFAGGSLLGVAFVHWLAFQSLYRIGALCPWCLVVWSVTVPLGLWSTLIAWRAVDPGSTAAIRLWGARYLVVLAWYLLVVVLATVRFWDYWSTLV